MFLENGKVRFCRALVRGGKIAAVTFMCLLAGHVYDATSAILGKDGVIHKAEAAITWRTVATDTNQKVSGATTSVAGYLPKTNAVYSGETSSYIPQTNITITKATTTVNTSNSSQAYYLGYDNATNKLYLNKTNSTTGATEIQLKDKYENADQVVAALAGKGISAASLATTGAITSTGKITSKAGIAAGGKITGVTAGTAATEAANVSQTSTTAAGDGITVTTAANTNGSTKYTIAGKAATASALGMVKIGSNITNSSGTISLTKENIVAALGYTPPTADTNTTYSNMTAATADAAGKAGLVPAPAKGAQNYVLHGDGTWKADANTTYAAMTAAEATAGTATTARSITPKVLGDYVKSQTNNKITNLSVNGKTITFTKGDGTTGTITTQDNNTTYTAGSGLTLSGTAFSVNTNGTIASGNANPLKGGTVFTEVRPTADGSFVKKANSTADNLTALDNASKNAIKGLSANGNQITYTKGDGSTGAITVGKTYSGGKGIVINNANEVSTKNVLMYDADANDTATLAGASGTKLSNLKVATLSKTSTDAVTGSQLFATNQNIAGFAVDIKRNKENITSLNSSMTSALESVSSTSLLVDTLNNVKADTSLNNLSAAGRQVISNAAMNAVQEYMASRYGDSEVKPNNVNTSLHVASSLQKSVDPVSMSLMSVNPAPAGTNFVVYDDAQASQITLEGPVGTGTKITNLAEGELSAASMDAVIGAQLYEVTQHFDDFQSALSSNNTSIANAQTDINKMKTTNIQLESDVNTLKTEMETGFNVTVDGAKVKTVNPQDNYIDFIAGDGLKIEDSNGSVKFSLDASDLGGISQEQLDKKADLTYVDEQLGLKADKDSVYTKDETDGLLAEKADVSYVNTELGNVRNALDGKADKSSVYTKAETNHLLDAKADIAYVDNGLALKADKDSVYTKAEADDLFVGKTDMEETLGKKANKDASNIDVAAWVEKLGTGEVESGNTGLVTGNTVYDAISRVNGSDMITADHDLGSVRIAGNGKYDTLDAVDISKSNGEGRVLTGVLANPDDPFSAANVGYVDAISSNMAKQVNDAFYNMENKVSKMGANAAAMASLTPPPMDGDEKWALSAAVGNYKSETAAAVGAFYKPQDNVMVNVRGSFGNNENMVGAGVAVALQRGDAPSVSKAQLVRTVNAQATKINEQAARLDEQDNKLAMQASEIEAQANEIATLKAKMAEIISAVQANSK